MTNTWMLVNPVSSVRAISRLEGTLHLTQRNKQLALEKVTANTVMFTLTSVNDL
jgi:small neutral amino acid transporter SnatA (MarC family)